MDSQTVGGLIVAGIIVLLILAACWSPEEEETWILRIGKKRGRYTLKEAAIIKHQTYPLPDTIDIYTPRRTRYRQRIHQPMLPDLETSSSLKGIKLGSNYFNKRNRFLEEDSFQIGKKTPIFSLKEPEWDNRFLSRKNSRFFEEQYPLRRIGVSKLKKDQLDW
jgi:hypothetical protein